MQIAYSAYRTRRLRAARAVWSQAVGHDKHNQAYASEAQGQRDRVNDCGDHCITCSDEGIPMQVERIDEARRLALCTAEDGSKSTVEIAALCGVRAEVNYEGQAAVELEAALDPDEDGAYEVALRDDGGGPLVIDARPTVRAVVADLEHDVEVATISARFHNGLAAATARACELTAKRCGADTIVLSGGVFQNRRMLAHTAALLEDSGMRVLTPRLLPPNDGGIAYGQLAVAAARLAREGRADVRA